MGRSGPIALAAGSDGRLDLREARPQSLGHNFLARNRDRFAGHGFLVAVLDAPSDRPAPEGLDRFRTTEEHATDVSAVIAWLRREGAGPVWLVGTSMGTVSAASVASRLREGGPDGLVLTSSVTRPNPRRESLADVRLADIRIPTLVVHHRDDGCRSTPYADAPGLVRRLTGAPRRELLAFGGGDPPRSRPCEARSEHGFYGLDAPVVEAIARWIKTAF